MNQSPYEYTDLPRSQTSLAAKGMGAQGMKGGRKDARRLADFVFKMAECSMADDYAIFKKEHGSVCFTNFEGKVFFFIQCARRKLFSYN